MKSSKFICIVLFFIVCPLYSQPSDLLWHLPGTDSLQVRSLGAPGDVNMDGYDDVVILRRGNNSTTDYFELYFGGNPMDTTPDFIYNYNISGSYKVVPNLNGDSIPDFMIGPDIYFGGLPLSNEPDISLPTGDNTNFPQLGYVYIGDINNDGYSDIKGTTWYYNDYFDMVTLHFGGPNMDSIPDHTWDIPMVSSAIPFYPMMFNDDDMIHDFSLLFFSNGMGFDSTYLFYGSDSFTFEPDSIRHESTILYYVDDFTGDGYPEFVTYIQSDGPNYSPLAVYNGGGPQDTSNINSILHIWGENLHQCTPTGDVNGDGFNDFVLNGAQSGGGYGGVHLYLGGPTIRTTPVAIWSGSYSGPPAIGAGRGAKKIGDINGDGLDDIFFLSRDDIHQPKGHAYIYSGDSSWVNPYVYMDIEKSAEVPNHFSIDAPYPNPFNTRVVIPYELTKDSAIDLRIFNIKGNLVKQLFKGHQISGKHEITWDASAFASGVYLIQLESDMYKKHQKVMLIK